MTDAYLVLTTPTTTDVFPVRDVERIFHDGNSLRVATKLASKDGLFVSTFAVEIPTDDPAEALRIATDALDDAILTGQSGRADVGCAKLAGAPDCETKTATPPTVEEVDELWKRYRAARKALDSVEETLDTLPGGLRCPT